MKRILLYIFMLFSLFLNSDLIALKRNYAWLDDFCVIHFPFKNPPDISMDLMYLIPEEGPACAGMDFHYDKYGDYCETFCENFSIYQGYWDPKFKRYILHLKNQLIYYNQHGNCTCYWPEYSQEAAQISDLAYLLFQDLIINTALCDLLRDENKQQNFTQLKNIFGEHGLILYFIVQQFRFSDYYHVCKDIRNYAEVNYSSKESTKIKDKLENILDILSSRFSSLYTKCLALHSSLEIEQEMYFIRLLSGDLFKDYYSLNSIKMSSIEENKEISILTECCLFNRFASTNTSLNGYAVPFSLQSEILLEKGTILNNQLSYKESIPILTESIKLDQLNREALIERAIAYFETDQIELALQDYRKAKSLTIIPPFVFNTTELSMDYFHNNPESDATPYMENDWEYFKGFVVGAAEGSKESIKAFIPSTLSTLRGIGNFLWSALPNINPLMGMIPEFTKASYNCMVGCVEYFKLNSAQEIAEGLIPEFKELVLKWSQVSDYEKGKMIGFTLGKYGLDIIASTKAVKVARRYQELKRANMMLTLEICEASAINKAKILEEAAKRLAFRQNLLKNGKIKIHWDKQNKHIPGSHNFEKGKSTIIISKEKLEELLEEYAGKGEVVGKRAPGIAGYKERIDFKEIIGECVYKENNIDKKAMTTKGIIHYDLEGCIHVVPSKP